MTINVTYLIVILLVFLGLALLRDALRKKSSAKDDTAEVASPLSANELEPTMTGKFRVQQVFKDKNSSPDSESLKKSHDTLPASEGEESLPDPFDDEKDKTH